MSDLSANPSSPSFQLCKRVFNRCQAIIFAKDDQDNDNSQYKLNQTQRVRENVFPALVGMGAILAGIGQPSSTKLVGNVALAQGRKARNSIANSADASIVSRRNTIYNDDSEEDDNNTNTEDDHKVSDEPKRASLPAGELHLLPFQSSSTPNSQSKRKSQPQSATAPFSSFLSKDSHFSVSLEDLHRGKAFSVSKYLKDAHQKINQKVKKATMVSHDANAPSQLFDGGRGMNSTSMRAMAQSSIPTLTNLDSSAPTTPVTTYSPSLSATSDDVLGQSPPKRVSLLMEEQDMINNSSSSDDDEVYALAKLSTDDRRQLLRSNYFRSEMQFILALVDIATRLVIVPKPARLSALHAELTLLNHNLPAEICMPLWCPATVEKPYHHRIVRISPTDAVVLNSAERVKEAFFFLREKTA